MTLACGCREDAELADSSHTTQATSTAPHPTAVRAKEALETEEKIMSHNYPLVLAQINPPRRSPDSQPGSGGCLEADMSRDSRGTKLRGLSDPLENGWPSWADLLTMGSF